MSSIEMSLPKIMMEDDKPKEVTATSPKACRRPRTSEDFYLFCTYVLEYENYDAQKTEEIRNISNQSPPLDSSGSSVNSESTNSGHEEDKPSGDETDDGDSFDLVTCFCGKPFAGRPMIECSLCLTWIHLSCARIKKTQIPEVFHCAMCKSTKKQRSPSPSEAAESGLKRPKRST